MPLKKEDLLDSMLYDGKTYDEIATELKIGYNTISKRVKFLGLNKKTSFKVVDKKNGATTTKYRKAKYKNQFTPEDFDFICDLIIKLSKRPGVLKKNDFKKAMLILTKYQ